MSSDQSQSSKDGKKPKKPAKKFPAPEEAEAYQHRQMDPGKIPSKETDGYPLSFLATWCDYSHTIGDTNHGIGRVQYGIWRKWHLTKNDQKRTDRRGNRQVLAGGKWPPFQDTVSTTGNVTLGRLADIETVDFAPNWPNMRQSIRELADYQMALNPHFARDIREARKIIQGWTVRKLLHDEVI